MEGLSVLNVMQNLLGDVQRSLFGSVLVQQLKRLAGNCNMAASNFITKVGRLVLEYAKPIDTGLKIIGFVYDSKGRHLDSRKVLTILEWKPCKDITKLRGFVGICMFYRIFVVSYSTIAAPLF